jgi:hypothetical protein
MTTSFFTAGALQVKRLKKYLTIFSAFGHNYFNFPIDQTKELFASLDRAYALFPIP